MQQKAADRTNAARAAGLLEASATCIHELVEPLRDALPPAHFHYFVRRVTEPLGEVLELLSDLHRRHPETNPNSDDARQTETWKRRERERRAMQELWARAEQTPTEVVDGKLSRESQPSAPNALKLDKVTVVRLEGSLQATRLTLEGIYQRLYFLLPASWRPKIHTTFKRAISEINKISSELCAKHPEARSDTELRLYRMIRRAWRLAGKANRRLQATLPKPL